MMAGETNLATLLNELEVKHHPGRWCFETQPHPPDLSLVPMAFSETEGWTVIRPALAEEKQPVWAWLELSVHSSLEAVGFLAAISKALAEKGVPCNAVAAFHHDHIFVPETKADLAIKAIEALSCQR